jgi:hypothetical protein
VCQGLSVVISQLPRVFSRRLNLNTMYKMVEVLNGTRGENLKLPRNIAFREVILHKIRKVRGVSERRGSAF